VPPRARIQVDSREVLPALKAQNQVHSQADNKGVNPALKARNQVHSQMDNKAVLLPLLVAHPERLPQMASRPVQILGPAALYPYLKMWVTVVMMILYYVRFAKQPCMRKIPYYVKGCGKNIAASGTKSSAMRANLNKYRLLQLFTILLLSGLTFSVQAGIEKVTSTTIQPLKSPSSPTPVRALLDVAIPTLNDGLYLTDEDDTVFPEVRYAEAIYFSNQLAKVMEKSGAWGAIRVTPTADVVMDVYVTGTIVQSDGANTSDDTLCALFFIHTGFHH